jgi:hypothetical protein
VEVGTRAIGLIVSITGLPATRYIATDDFAPLAVIRSPKQVKNP